MKIYILPSLKLSNGQYNTAVCKNAAAEQNSSVHSEYAPLYYEDYGINLNFKGRSPEDFYEQDFNKKYMPKTMAEYLNSDFEDRHHLPPVQLMNEAFDDLSVASTVDDIKLELYPNEPLFANLKPANYNNATRGVLRKIGEVKKECINEGLEPEPLFRDGSDDLTTYIVKKIYLEGKTVKEIDKDFENDINDLYKGIIKSISSNTTKSLKEGESKYFSNSTTYSLGIRFPYISFWNSLISTRDDYEKVGRRKVGGKFENSENGSGTSTSSGAGTKDSVENNPEVNHVPRRPRFNEPRVRQIADTITESRGDISKARHNLNRRARGTSELSFVQKYWGEIMSVATEKVHLSEELSIFYEKVKKAQSLEADAENNALENFVLGNDLTNSEVDLLKRFWNYHSNDRLKDNFSEAISSTIKEFAEAYDEDGYSEEFEIMLQYARNIKPNREQAKRLHDEIQLEYDELGESLAAYDRLCIDIDNSLNRLLDLKTPKYNLSIGDNIVIPSDVDPKALFEESLKKSLRVLPDVYINNKIKDIRSHFKTDEEYTKFALSFCREDINIPEEYQEYLYSREEALNIAVEAKEVFKYRNPKVMNLTSTAILDFFMKHGCTDDTLKSINAYSQTSVDSMASFLSDKVLTNEPSKLNAIKTEISQIYHSLSDRPLSKKDIKKINDMIYNYAVNFDPANILEFDGTPVKPLLMLITYTCSRHDDAKSLMKKIIFENSDALDIVGPAISYLLRDDANENIKKVLIERCMADILIKNPMMIAKLTTYDPNAFNYFLNDYPWLKEKYLDLVTRSYINGLSPAELLVLNQEFRKIKLTNG